MCCNKMQCTSITATWRHVLLYFYSSKESSSSWNCSPSVSSILIMVRTATYCKMCECGFQALRFTQNDIITFAEFSMILWGPETSGTWKFGILYGGLANTSSSTPPIDFPKFQTALKCFYKTTEGHVVKQTYRIHCYLQKWKFWSRI